MAKSITKGNDTTTKNNSEDKLENNSTAKAHCIWYITHKNSITPKGLLYTVYTTDTLQKTYQIDSQVCTALYI